VRSKPNILLHHLAPGTALREEASSQAVNPGVSGRTDDVPRIRQLVLKHMLTKDETMILCYLLIRYPDLNPTAREDLLKRAEELHSSAAAAFRECLSLNPEF
jgi:hypothetical protein